MEVNKHVGNLQNKSLAELQELLERQEKLLANVKLLNKLKDQGKNIRKLREEIKKEIDKGDEELDATTNLLEKLEMSSNDDKGLIRAENEMSIKPSVLETLANNEATNTLKKKTIQSKKNVSFYSKLCQEIDAKESNKKQEKPNRPNPMNVPRERIKSTPIFEEESAVRYPVGPHNDVQLISLQESIRLEKDYVNRMTKNQCIDATNSLMQTNSIKMSDYLPDPVTNMSYREVTDIDSDLD